MKINRFSNDTDKPFHSHTYAEAGNGSLMGATSPESFSRRYQIDQNRSHIARYRDSFVARNGFREGLNSRMSDQQSTSAEPSLQDDSSSRQAFNTRGISVSPQPRSAAMLQVPKRGYSEPTPRNYNPFS